MPQDKPDTLVYILAHPSRQAADAAWQAFRADPDWIAAKAASEKDGSLTTKFRLTIAFPISGRPAEPIEDYQIAELPAFRCMAADYVGPMPDIQIAYDEILHAISSSGRSRSPESREIYKKWIGFESPDNVTELQVGVA